MDFFWGLRSLSASARARTWCILSPTGSTKGFGVEWCPPWVWLGDGLPYYSCHDGVGADHLITGNTDRDQNCRRLVSALDWLFNAEGYCRRRRHRTAGGVFPGNIYTRAVITNVLNPKVAIFYLSFLPQFISPDGQHARMGLVVLGVSFLIMGLLVDATVGFLSGKVRHLLASNASVGKTLNLVSGIIFCTLGLLQMISLLLSHSK